MKLPKKQSLGMWGVTYTTTSDPKGTSILCEVQVCKWKVYCWLLWQAIKKRLTL